MPQFIHDPFARTNVNGPVTSSATTIPVPSGEGTRFLAPQQLVMWDATLWESWVEAFYAIEDGSPVEIIHITADGVSDALPVVERAKEGTAALDMTDSTHTFRIQSVQTSFLVGLLANIGTLVVTVGGVDVEEGDVIIGDGAWDGQRLQLGIDQYLWVDALGDVRIKIGSAPVSDLDGSVVGGGGGGGGSTLQQAYELGSGPPQIVVTAADGGVTIRDAATPTGADLFAVQNNAGGGLFAVDVGRIEAGVDVNPSADNTLDIGQPDGTNRFRTVNGRLGIFVGAGAGYTPTLVTPLAPGNEGGIIAGSQFGAGTEVHELDSGNPTFPSIATMGNTFAYYATDTAELINRGGGSIVFGSAYSSYGNGTARIIATGFGNFTHGYAFAYGGDVYIENQGPGAFVGGYPVGSGGGTSTIKSFATAGGAFVWGRIPGGLGSAGLQQIQARGAGSFVQGFANCLDAAGRARLQSANNADGAFVQGVALADGGFNATIQVGGNDRGGFAQGAAVAVVATASILANQDGAFSQGYARDAEINTTGVGGFSHGFALDYNITATASGAFAVGYTDTGVITASAANSVQFGPGVNAVADSLQVGANFRANASGQHAGARETVTLAAAVTTFVIGSNSIEVTGDAGANTIATITGGIAGQTLVVQFVDALVTITDDNSHAADSVDLNAAFTSADDTILFLFYDGVSWYEIQRSIN